MLNLTNNQLQNNRYALYREWRKTKPVQMVSGGFGGDGWLATRYQDVDTVLRDDRFTNDRHRVGRKVDWLENRWTPGILQALLNSIMLVDDPEHTRLKNLVHQAFTPRRVREMQQTIDALCHELLDKAEQQKTVDFVEDFALPLPMTIITRMMGIEDSSDRDKFHTWTSSFLGNTPTSLKSRLTLIRHGFSMYRFFRQLIKDRRANPADDLTGALVLAEYNGEYMSDDEITGMLFALLVAGHETTVHLLSSGLLALLQHPEQLALLKSQPDITGAAIEELLRYTSPIVIGAPRYALVDTELSGVAIARGEIVYPALASANRDETVFEKPDALDITRNPNRHLALGMGAHYCLGAPLARLETTIAFRILLERYPNLELAVPAEAINEITSPVIQGVESLPIRLRP